MLGDKQDLPADFTPEIALQNLAAIIAQYRGSLQEHQLLQQSIQVLGEAIQPKKEENE